MSAKAKLLEYLHRTGQRRHTNSCNQEEFVGRLTYGESGTTRRKGGIALDVVRQQWHLYARTGRMPLYSMLSRSLQDALNAFTG